MHDPTAYRPDVMDTGPVAADAEPQVDAELSAAGRAGLYAHAEPGTQLVVGLHWFAVVGSHATALARLRARQTGATHFVVGGAGGLTCGCLRLTRRHGLMRGPRAARILVSAAQAFAHLAQGQPRAGLACLPDGRWWLAATQDGAVLTRADRVYLSRAEAEAALQALCTRHPLLVVCDAAALYLQASRQVVPGARLQPVRRWHPVPLVCAAAVATGAGWIAFGGAVQADPPPVVAQAPAPSPPVEAGLRVQDGHALPDALASFNRLPLGVLGWRLEQARCLWQGAAPAWDCDARYRRVATEATSAQFVQRRPAGWTLAFPSLDQADLGWRVPAREARVIAPSGTAPGAPPSATGLSLLQTHRASLTRLQVSAPQAHGEGAVARRRSVALQGPLRVVTAMPWSALQAHWQRLSMRVDLASPSQGPRSPLLVDLDGDVYEP
ncbi:hypothetical protein CEK29_06845 [Bordetella genomosp. 5]|uniref:hypothetical protein n=1 Tax=Bordetella genomosp. 5 TaxID=1395608 RepID=UPI000B9EC072|nr:hypothetical protein [Bordetella genomosp. 5]OZI44444.1 hypothetical protein CEK29_06845 [Bordetella genomosp. 5]